MAMLVQTEHIEPGRNAKYRPYAFTEQGVAMLSSVLRSRRAILVNVEIMRAFVRLRALARSVAELRRPESPEATRSLSSVRAE